MNLGLYSDDQESSIYIRREAQTWRRSGLIAEEQRQAVYSLCDPQVRQTNLFFRILFFVFTLLCAGAIAGLTAWLLEKRGDETVLAAVIFIQGIISLSAAEYLAGKIRFYRHGIEEALAMAGMILCVAALMIFADDLRRYGRGVSIAAFSILSAAACWIYLRFGYLYAAVISLLALFALPFQFSISHVAQRLILLGFLSMILLVRLFLDTRISHDFKKEKNTILLTCLLAAIYLTVNLHVLGVIGLFSGAIGIGHFHPESFPRSLYWASYVLTFALPAAVIFGGIKSRRRLILNAGLVMAVVTLATNKSYLGLTRYAWDPAILGVFMIGLSLFLTRWLNRGADQKRSGFTAREILKPEDHGATLADVAAALTPAAIEAGKPPQAPLSDAYLGGGASGGGGAERNI